MYGTREALCLELERMFEPDDALVLLVWTEEGVFAACREYALEPDEAEIKAIMKVTGHTPMDVYRTEGVTKASISDLLSRHREALNRQVSVPAVLLKRVLVRLESELENRVGESWDAGITEPKSLRDALNDLHVLKESLAA